MSVPTTAAAVTGAGAGVFREFALATDGCVIIDAEVLRLGLG